MSLRINSSVSQYQGKVRDRNCNYDGEYSGDFALAIPTKGWHLLIILFWERIPYE